MLMVWLGNVRVKFFMLFCVMLMGSGKLKGVLFFWGCVGVEFSCVMVSLFMDILLIYIWGLNK